MSVEAVEQEVAARKISNSEAQAFKSCETRYRYEYIDNLEPIATPGPLAIGILGHDAMEAFWSVRVEGGSFERGMEAAEDRIGWNIREGRTDYPTAATVQRVLSMYWAHYGPEDHYVPVAVEKMYELPLTDEFTMPMRLDLLLKDERTGAYILRDFKFVYDFWDEAAHLLNPQFPKYIGALRYNGVDIHEAQLDEIRHRQLKAPDPSQLLRRTPYRPSQFKVDAALIDHINTSRKIMEFRSHDADWQKQNALRAYNKVVCKWCSYKDLCLMDLEGADTTLTIAAEFRQKQSYGYNNENKETL